MIRIITQEGSTICTCFVFLTKLLTLEPVEIEFQDLCRLILSNKTVILYYEWLQRRENEKTLLCRCVKDL